MDTINKLVENNMEFILLATYKALRKRPHITNPEFIGLFINYCYQFTQTHDGLDSRDFTVVTSDNNIKCIKYNRPYTTFKHINIAVRDAIQDLQFTDFYTLYLRSSFEEPNHEKWERIKEQNRVTTTPSSNIEIPKAQKDLITDLDYNNKLNSNYKYN